MIRRPPRSTRTDTLFPYTTLFRSLVASLRRIGLTVENGFRYAHLPPDERAAIERGVADGLAIIREKTRHLGTLSGGWSTSYAGSRFGRVFLLRAAVAMDQIYVLDKGAALYPVAHQLGSASGRESVCQYV